MILSSPSGSSSFGSSFMFTLDFFLGFSSLEESFEFLKVFYSLDPFVYLASS